MQRFRNNLLKWYRKHRRRLPWRAARPDPYHVLVSEIMLQQTQVATVIPYFQRFVQRFATVYELAGASEQEVLRLWQGLGYYRRARMLHETARVIVAKHNGVVPDTVEALLELPGIGRYTAGAIASIAFDRSEPVLDGNVARVLCRVEGIEADVRRTDVVRRLWKLAGTLVPRRGPGEFNSAMMELGATVCTPRNPRCCQCPVSAHCVAKKEGMQERIPPPAKRKSLPVIHRRVLCIQRNERWLIEQRPPTGRWASMWQFITVEANGKRPGGGRSLGTIEHTLTHRRYVFEVFLCNLNGRARGKWARLDELDQYPMTGPHRRVAEMLRVTSAPTQTRAPARRRTAARPAAR